MPQIEYRDYSHPNQEGGVVGWVHSLDVDGESDVSAQVALSRGVTHPELARRVTDYADLDVEIPSSLDIPAQRLILVSHATTADKPPEVVYRLIGSGGEDVGSEKSHNLQPVVRGLVKVTLMACLDALPRSGTLAIPDSFDEPNLQWVEV